MSESKKFSVVFPAAMWEMIAGLKESTGIPENKIIKICCSEAPAIIARHMESKAKEIQNPAREA